MYAIKVFHRLQINICDMNEQVTQKLPEADWFQRGGLEEREADSMMEEDDGNTFFYQKW